jgi:hypothetical protein
VQTRYQYMARVIIGGYTHCLNISSSQGGTIHVSENSHGQERVKEDAVLCQLILIPFLRRRLH